jgi:hypothetical protein
MLRSCYSTEVLFDDPFARLLADQPFVVLTADDGVTELRVDGDDSPQSIQWY